MLCRVLFTHYLILFLRHIANFHILLGFFRECLSLPSYDLPQFIIIYYLAIWCPNIIIDVRHYNCSVSGIFSFEIRLGPFFWLVVWGWCGGWCSGGGWALPQVWPPLRVAVVCVSLSADWGVSTSPGSQVCCLCVLTALQPSVLSLPNLYPHPQEETKSFPFSSHSSNTLKSKNIPEGAHQYEHLKPAEALSEVGTRRKLPCCQRKRTSISGWQLTLWISLDRSQLSTETSCRSKIWTSLGRWY